MAKLNLLRDMISPPGVHACVDGDRWVRAVPAPYDGNRLYGAISVLLGRAYAIKWPEAGDLEDALRGEDKTNG